MVVQPLENPLSGERAYLVHQDGQGLIVDFRQELMPLLLDHLERIEVQILHTLATRASTRHDSKRLAATLGCAWAHPQSGDTLRSGPFTVRATSPSTQAEGVFLLVDGHLFTGLPLASTLALLSGEHQVHPGSIEAPARERAARDGDAEIPIESWPGLSTLR